MNIDSVREQTLQQKHCIYLFRHTKKVKTNTLKIEIAKRILQGATALGATHNFIQHSRLGKHSGLVLRLGPAFSA